MHTPKWCHVYARKDGVYVITGCTTDVGIGIETGPVEKLPGQPELRRLGESVLAAISCSKQIGQPTNRNDFAAIKQDVLKALSFRNWKQFVVNASLVAVRSSGSDLSIVQYEYTGEQSFLEVQGGSFTVPNECGVVGAIISSLLGLE